jgi:hypothetical protein
MNKYALALKVAFGGRSLLQSWAGPIHLCQRNEAWAMSCLVDPYAIRIYRGRSTVAQQRRAPAEPHDELDPGDLALAVMAAVPVSVGTRLMTSWTKRNAPTTMTDSASLSVNSRDISVSNAMPKAPGMNGLPRSGYYRAKAMTGWPRDAGLPCGLWMGGDPSRVAVAENI